MLDSGFKAELSHTCTIALRRPGGVVTNVDGDTAQRNAWFDGKTVTVLDRKHNRYAVVDTPDDIDEMLDYVAEEFDIVFPLADILHSDVYRSLTEAREGAAIGAAVGAGVGTVASAATKGQQVVIGEGTVIQFKLEEPLTVPIDCSLVLGALLLATSIFFGRAIRLNGRMCRESLQRFFNGSFELGIGTFGQLA